MNEMTLENKTDSQAEKKSVRLETGTVISNKMDKTIVVLVTTKKRHPKYGKYIKRHTKLFAHDEINQCKEGDMVVIKQSRPLSKKKHWELVEILKQA